MVEVQISEREMKICELMAEALDLIIDEIGERDEQGEADVMEVGVAFLDTAKELVSRMVQQEMEGTEELRQNYVSELVKNFSEYTQAVQS